MQPAEEGQHVIVCGMGHVGYRVVGLLLRLGLRVTVVTQEARAEWVRTVEARGVRLVWGDARDQQLLVEAGVETALALIADTDQDLVNIEIALDAKQLHPGIPVVVRLFDQNLARRLEPSLDVRRAPAMSALAAPTFAAAVMGKAVESAFRVDETLFVAGRLQVEAGGPLDGRTVGQIGEERGLLVLAREKEGGGATVTPSGDTTVAAGDCLLVMGEAACWRESAGVTTCPRASGKRRKRRRPEGHTGRASAWLAAAQRALRSVPLPLGVAFLTLNLLIVLSVFIFHLAMDLSLVDALYFIVTTVTTVGYGDITPRSAPDALKLYGCLVMLLGSATIATLYSIITDLIVTTRIRQFLGPGRPPHDGHVVVVGMGNLGYRVAEELWRTSTRVAGIERDAAGEFVDAVRAHAPVVIGDARVEGILKRAGSAGASAVLALTDDDAANLSIGLAAKQMNPDARVVVRLFDADLARKVEETLDLDAALSASRIAAPGFVAAALYPGVHSAFVADHSLYAVFDGSIGDEWHGQPAAAFLAAHDAHLMMRRRPRDRAFVPAQDDLLLERGDAVIAVACRTLAP